ncbi:hydroxymethylglutaryl-CoA synthase family protein [Lachnotalea glycerini]|uniref:Hydroxymethylglutaryl-CoA synthase family protein n=1 Tax=Lachnotalea glycerini TaxID=1763509 RepID=A0A371JJJ5_9FIRM|nr:hydroxymethylglutaryl-CoA synthase family protein [Lachnotalea glycerini]RDY32915.1 hydroxymethylglutaryl-CoA synthase family protein [Lachnotalea glycerini]
MLNVGIEAINFFGGTACLNVRHLAEYRKLDTTRFENLLMKEKSVILPYEDPVTLGVNAAKPIIDSLSEEEKNKIELLITCTESGIDFGKSLSTYVHDYLGLNRHCRLMEIKNACYSGTAGFQMAVNFILSQSSPGAKALVIASDLARFMTVDAGEVLTEDWSFAEPSSGAGAAAILVSEKPYVFQVDIGANGYYGYEVMDTCRPVPDNEAGNSDLSLLSYLDCCEQAYLHYQSKVENADYQKTFDYIAYHTPFGGMVKGVHRTMMRKMVKAKPAEIEKDFKERVTPGMTFCQRVGNVMGATVFLSLLSTIHNGNFEQPKRIGCFSYGSGCCCEFYSGVVTQKGKDIILGYDVDSQLSQRYRLSIEEYNKLLMQSNFIPFGTRNCIMNFDLIPGIMESMKGKNRLYLTEIKEFHREYQWI